MELDFNLLGNQPEDQHINLKLSALIDADSFFYGLWDNEFHLKKASLLRTEDALPTNLLEHIGYKITKPKIGLSNRLFTLVPSKEFRSEDMKSWISASCSLPSDNKIVYRNDFSDRFNLHVVYAVAGHLIKMLSNTFQAPRMTHIMTALLQTVPHESKPASVRLTILDKLCFIVVMKNNRLVLANSYDIQGVSDLLYFVSLIFNTFNLDRVRTPIEISGLVERDSDKILLIKKYFGSVQFIRPSFRIEEKNRDSLSYEPLFVIAKCV